MKYVEFYKISFFKSLLRYNLHKTKFTSQSVQFNEVLANVQSFNHHRNQDIEMPIAPQISTWFFCSRFPFTPPVPVKHWLIFSSYRTSFSRVLYKWTDRICCLFICVLIIHPFIAEQYSIASVYKIGSYLPQLVGIWSVSRFQLP